MTRSLALIYNPHQAGWDEGYAAGLAAGAATEDVYKPGLGARMHEVLRRQQALSEENSDLAASLSNKEDELTARDAQIATLQAALEKAAGALGDNACDCEGQCSSFGIPMKMCAHYLAAKALASIKQAKDSAS